MSYFKLESCPILTYDLAKSAPYQLYDDTYITPSTPLTQRQKKTLQGESDAEKKSRSSALRHRYKARNDLKVSNTYERTIAATNHNFSNFSCEHYKIIYDSFCSQNVKLHYTNTEATPISPIAKDLCLLHNYKLNYMTLNPIDSRARLVTLVVLSNMAAVTPSLRCELFLFHY